jgi:DNA polymerase-3 subunit gamma/tau
MTYLPLARKYRPQTFEDLVGQAHVTTTLTHALQQRRLGQAYLFTGQRGVGKTSAARILAKGLNCASGPTAAPCNQCPSCVQIVQGTSLDVIEIDGASNRGIDEIRSLRETVGFAPTGGGFRIYIIDEVHMLTMEAFNALLKTLEEPPAHVKFVFATTAAQKVPATILSRCQRFDFRRLEAPLIVETLRRIATAERLAVDDKALYAIARAADGSLRDAEVILEQAASFAEGPVQEQDVTTLLGAMESEALFEWAQAILDRDARAALAVLTQQLEQGREAPQLLSGLTRHIRNLLVVRSTEGAEGGEALCARLIDEPAERLARLADQAKRLTPQELLLILQILTGVYEVVRRSPVARTILELVVIKLATREEWQSLEQISRRLEQLTGGPAQESRPAAARPALASQGTPAPAPVATGQAAGAAPMSVASAAPEELVGLWPVFLERLGTQKISLAAYLADSKPLKREGRVLTVGLPGFALHQEVLRAVESQRLIERLLGDLCQAPVTVEYTTLPHPDEPQPAAAGEAQASPTPPIVQEIVNLFNATILDPPPRPAS